MRHYMIEFERRARESDDDPEGDAWAAEPFPPGEHLRPLDATAADADCEHYWVLAEDQDPVAFAAYLTRQQVFWTYRVFHNAMGNPQYECDAEGRYLRRSS